MNWGPRFFWYWRHRIWSGIRVRAKVLLLVALMAFVLIFFRNEEFSTWPQHVLQRGTRDVADKRLTRIDVGNLTSFYGLFSNQTQLSDVLLRIHDAGPRHSLTLPLGDFRVGEVMKSRQLVVQAETHALYKYLVSFPVRGELRSVGAYVADVTDQDSSVGLIALTFPREGSPSIGNEYFLSFEIYATDGN
jgi:hypothetical protein